MNYSKKLQSKEKIVSFSREIFSLEFVQEILNISGYDLTVVMGLHDDTHAVEEIAGVCMHESKEICISLLGHVGHTYNSLLDTIAHELAHIVHSCHNRKHVAFKTKIKKIIKCDLEGIVA